MLGGFSYKEPPKFLFRQELFHTSGDGSALRDNFTAVTFSDDGTRLFGVALHDLPITNQGAVYEFKQQNGSWQQTAMITASTNEGDPTDQFGSPAQCVGDYLFVGAPNDNDNGTAAGAAFVFHSSSAGWAQVQKLLATDPDGSPANDKFGADLCVSADGRVLAAGAVGDYEGFGQKYGSFYIFTSSSAGWEQQQKIILTHPILNELLGSSIKMTSDGSKIVVGAKNATWPIPVPSGYMTSSTGPNTGGVALVYESGSAGWEMTQIITAPDATGGDLFGSCGMTPDGEFLAVGARSADTAGSNTGTVYVFKKGASGQFENYATLTPNTTEALGGKYFGDTLSFVKVDTGSSRQLVLCASAPLALSGEKGLAWVWKDDGEGFVQYQDLDGGSNSWRYGHNSVMTGDRKWLAVTSYLDNSQTYQAGSIYLYEWSDEY